MTGVGVAFYFELAWRQARRQPTTYWLSVIVLSLGLGLFCSSASLYYWLNRDPIPSKSAQLFFPLWNAAPSSCEHCLPLRVHRYHDVMALTSSTIPSAQAAMFESFSYVRAADAETMSASPVPVRVTQKDFFTLFDVPFLHGQPWRDDTPRREAILSKAFAESLFARSDVVGEFILVADHPFEIVGVTAEWEMRPRLYDLYKDDALNTAPGLFIPFETAYDLAIKATTNTYVMDERNYQQSFAEEARQGEFYQAQLWLQLETPDDVQAYQKFMLKLAQHEKNHQRHLNPIQNKLINILEVPEAFNQSNPQVRVFCVVSVLFLFVCILNASYLSLSRYLSYQSEYGLFRALGASRWHLHKVLLADVSILGGTTTLASVLWMKLTLETIKIYMPFRLSIEMWQPTMLATMIAAVFLSCYLVVIYPWYRAAFSSMSGLISRGVV